jgi:hypothetical protein
MINPLSLLLSNGRLVAIGLAVLFVFSAGWKTHSLITEAREADIIKKAQQQVIEKQHEFIKKAAEADNDYQFKISALRKRYNDIVKLRAGDNNLPCITPAPGKPDAPPRGTGLYGQALVGLLFQADQQTQQLIALQEWIKSTHR